MEWNYEGDDVKGLIRGSEGVYPYRVEDGEVRVLLPFPVDQDALRELLRRDGWPVALEHDRLESQGWGLEYDVEGYYPYWVRPDPESGGAVFAFPPQDYKTGPGDRIQDANAFSLGPGERDDVPQTGDGSEPDGYEPVFGPGALTLFARWYPYMKSAAKKNVRRP